MQNEEIKPDESIDDRILADPIFEATLTRIRQIIINHLSNTKDLPKFHNAAYELCNHIADLCVLVLCEAKPQARPEFFDILAKRVDEFLKLSNEEFEAKKSKTGEKIHVH